ncbi:DUF3077 domain-containing protein [Pseudomonas sp.]|uniref:DUF3077 domain-containing protein n=1 Tax=Pseudomonas sp. TaxID=306 RepID=UPI0034E07FE3
MGSLFPVSLGVPIEGALERAANLMIYVEALSAADAFVNKGLESAIVQTLSEMAKALVKASKQGEGKS